MSIGSWSHHAKEDGKSVPSGNVVLRVSGAADAPGGLGYQPVKVKNGAFATELKYQGKIVKAFYIPPPGYADCESADVKA